MLDRDKELCQQLSRETDALIVNGDGTQLKTLEEIDAKSAQVLIAVTDRDEVNLLSSLMAKDLGVKTVITRVSNPEHREVFKSLGIDYVISPEVTGAEHIESLITRLGERIRRTRPAILGKGNIKLREFAVRPESKAVGKSVEEVRSRDFLITAVQKGGEVIIPNGSIKLEPGDRVLVLAKSEAMKDVEALF